MYEKCGKWVAMMRERATQIATERGAVSTADLRGYEKELASQGTPKPHPRAYTNVFRCRQFKLSHSVKIPCVNILNGRKVTATREVNCYRLRRPEDDDVPMWNNIPPFNARCRTAGKYNL